VSPVGGATYVWQSSLTIEDCVYENNGAGVLAGGAIFIENGSARVLGSTFVANGGLDSLGEGSGYGSAIAICGTTGTLDVSDCVFERNGPGAFGGAILNFLRELTVADCLFVGNDASHGGGIASFGVATIVDSRFDANSSSHGGGIRLSVGDREAGVVDRCDFRDNTASFGGGINATTSAGDLTGAAGPVDVLDCLFVGNSASFGGAAHLYLGGAGSLRLANATVVGNAGGGVVASASEGGPVPLIANGIIRGNAGGQLSAGAGVAVRFSNVEGGFPGPGNIDADPLFADAPNRDFTLLAGSPSVDSGDGGSLPPAAVLDLARNARVRDGDGDGSAIVDMGAYELQGSAPDACGAGNVNASGAGGVTDVLFVNGSAGGQTRTVSIATGATATIDLVAPPAGPSTPRYLAYVWTGVPLNPRVLVARGAPLGCFVNPIPPMVGLAPQPAFCLAGQGIPARACSGAAKPAAPALAPWSISRVSRSPITVTFQGVVRDFSSSHPAGFSVTNAVTLVVGP